ncbi:ISxcd1 transposase [Xanthomonas axonopodis Xac29-1]|nr:ISxcd1 transposase [Xanthomonas axonopodis Xac29-1]
MGTSIPVAGERHIDRSYTWRNAYVGPADSHGSLLAGGYNRTVRYAWLATTLFDTIEQVQDKATRWLWTYNHERPNMALGGITPAMKLAMAA